MANARKKTMKREKSSMFPSFRHSAPTLPIYDFFVPLQTNYVNDLYKDKDYK